MAETAVLTPTMKLADLRPRVSAARVNSPRNCTVFCATVTYGAYRDSAGAVHGGLVGPDYAGVGWTGWASRPIPGKYDDAAARRAWDRQRHLYTGEYGDVGNRDDAI